MINNWKFKNLLISFLIWNKLLDQDNKVNQSNQQINNLERTQDQEVNQSFR